MLFPYVIPSVFEDVARERIYERRIGVNGGAVLALHPVERNGRWGFEQFGRRLPVPVIEIPLVALEKEVNDLLPCQNVIFCFEGIEGNDIDEDPRAGDFLIEDSEVCAIAAGDAHEPTGFESGFDLDALDGAGINAVLAIEVDAFEILY